MNLWFFSREINFGTKMNSCWSFFNDDFLCEIDLSVHKENRYLSLWFFTSSNQFYQEKTGKLKMHSAKEDTGTVWKNEKFSATQIFFSSNRFTVKYFSKTLIWRKFCVKTVAVKFRDFHNVRGPKHDQEFYVKSTFLLKKEVTKELISRKFLSLIAFYSTFPHCELLSLEVDFTKKF